MKKSLTWGALYDLKTRRELLKKTIWRIENKSIDRLKSLKKDLIILESEITRRENDINADVKYLLRHGWIRKKGPDPFNENFTHPILGEANYSLSGLRSQTEDFECFKKTGKLKYGTLQPEWSENKKKEFKKLIERHM